MSSLERFSEYREFGLERFHCIYIYIYIYMYIYIYSTSLLQTSLDIVITLKSINSLDTTSSLGIRVAPATQTRGEGGRRPPSPLVCII